MPARNKMIAALAAKSSQRFRVKPATLKEIRDCMDQTGNPDGCHWDIAIGTDPETGVDELFIEVFDGSGDLIGTFNDVWLCPPFC